MRLKIHHKIGKEVCGELMELGCQVHEKLFLLGNIFPDLIHSYLWCKHEYEHSKEYIRKKLDILKKRPRLFSFHLGVLTHYICDYFCYPHSTGYDKGLVQHIIYELRQKVPERIYRSRLSVSAFSIEELDGFVKWYENFRGIFDDDDSDFHIAAMVASNFLQAAY
ncbi:MAG: zinc dependent phospholipase C family protein [Treponema sp.]|jgi:hypothetical protein|nr:zinc dependent phospholipase C family protein [Treponema sp.]